MAKASWIVERNDTRRPCILFRADGVTKEKCLFHCWSTESYVVPPSLLKGGHMGGTESTTVAILEFEDGHLEKHTIESFKFSDMSFLQWAWNSDDEPIGRNVKDKESEENEENND